MTVKNKQALKRLTYICLSFSSIVISSEISAKRGFSENFVDDAANRGRISISQLGKNNTEDLEGSNLIGPSSKIFKHPEDDVQQDLKKFPQGKTKAKEAAKNAAKEAAQKAAYSILQNKEEAELIAQSIMKKAKLKKKDNPREDRLFHLVQNHAMNAARIAAEGAAYDVLKDEKEALEVVHSLKLQKYAKKANANKEKAFKLSSTTPKIKTLQDLKKNEERPIRIQIVPSHLDQAKEATEIGEKVVNGGFKVADFIMRLIK